MKYLTVIVLFFSASLVQANEIEIFIPTQSGMVGRCANVINALYKELPNIDQKLVYNEKSKQLVVIYGNGTVAVHGPKGSKAMNLERCSRTDKKGNSKKFLSKEVAKLQEIYTKGSQRLRYQIRRSMTSFECDTFVKKGFFEESAIDKQDHIILEGDAGALK